MEYYSENGDLIGISSKSEVHNNHLWHKTFHLWIFCTELQEKYIYLQRRSKNKDYEPSKLDCTVSGHYESFEILSDGIREIEEEIGLHIPFSKLHFLGIRTSYNNNEFQYVFSYEFTLNPTTLRFSSEIESIEKINCKQLLNLFNDEAKEIKSKNIVTNKVIFASKNDFINFQESKYYLFICNTLLGNLSEGLTSPNNLIDILSLKNSKLSKAFFKSSNSENIERDISSIINNKIALQKFYKSILYASKNENYFCNFLNQQILQGKTENIEFYIFILGWLNSKCSIKLLKELANHSNQNICIPSIFVLGELGLKYISFIADKVFECEQIAEVACFSLGWNQGEDRYLVLQNSLNKQHQNQRIIEKALKMYE